jgi:hypothetical protein
MVSCFSQGDSVRPKCRYAMDGIAFDKLLSRKHHDMIVAAV